MENRKENKKIKGSWCRRYSIPIIRNYRERKQWRGNNNTPQDNFLKLKAMGFQIKSCSPKCTPQWIKWDPHQFILFSNVRTQRTSRTCYRCQERKNILPNKVSKICKAMIFWVTTLKARRQWLRNSYEKMTFNLEFYASAIHKDIQFSNYLSVSVFSKNLFSMYWWMLKLGKHHLNQSIRVKISSNKTHLYHKCHGMMYIISVVFLPNMHNLYPIMRNNRDIQFKKMTRTHEISRSPKAGKEWGIVTVCRRLRRNND